MAYFINFYNFLQKQIFKLIFHWQILQERKLKYVFKFCELEIDARNEKYGESLLYKVGTRMLLEHWSSTGSGRFGEAPTGHGGIEDKNSPFLYTWAGCVGIGSKYVTGSLKR